MIAACFVDCFARCLNLNDPVCRSMHIGVLLGLDHQRLQCGTATWHRKESGCLVGRSRQRRRRSKPLCSHQTLTRVHTHMSQRALHTHNVPRRTVAHTYACTNKMKFDTFIQHMLRILARFVRCLPATASVTRYAHRRVTVASTANACGTASAAGVSAGSSMRGGQCRRSQHSNGRFPFLFLSCSCKLLCCHQCASCALCGCGFLVRYVNTQTKSPLPPLLRSHLWSI